MGLTYLDSCVVIDAFANPEPRGDIARAAIASSAPDLLATSPLVELECLVRPIRSGDRARIDGLRSILARFRQLTISERAYRLGAHIRAIHGLRTPDALHVATANINDCASLWTTDRVLLQALPGFAVEPGR